MAGRRGLRRGVRRRVLRRVAALVTGALVAVGFVAAAAPARADANSLLASTSFARMVVDTVHQRVFVSSFTGIEARRFDTTLVGVVPLPANTSVTSMAVSADGSTLWAVLPVAKAIARISTTTLAVSATYPMTTSCPKSIALAGSTLYVGYGCAAPRRVAPLTVSGTTASLGTPLTGTFSSGAPELEADPSGRWLVGAAGGTGLPVIVRWDLAATPPTALTKTDDLSISCDPPAVAVAAGELVSTCTNTGLVVGLSPVDLTPTTAYPFGGAQPQGAAVSSTAVAIGGYLNVPDVRVFPRGSTTPTRSLDFPDVGGQSRWLAPDGLASTPDGSHIFAVSTNGVAYRLWVLVDPLTAQSTLSLTAPATAPRAAALGLTGTLTADWSLGTGVTLGVTRKDLAGTHVLPDVTTDAAGAFSVSDTPDVGGPVTYTVSYPGTADRQPASVSKTVEVSRVTPALTVTTDASVYAYNAKATVTVHLGTTFDGRTVKVWSREIHKARVLLATGTVDASGNFTVQPAIKRQVTFTAEFPGDQRYAPRTVTTSVTARVAIAETAKRWYARSGSDYLYRTAVNPLLSAHFSPNVANRCATFVVQRFSAGAWRAWARTADCVTVDSSSNAAAELLGSHPRGYRFRMRAQFDGSAENAAKNGAWKYFRFR